MQAWCCVLPRRLLILLCLATCPDLGWAQVPQRPFPQAANTTGYGLRPDHLTASQRNAAVAAYYDDWKTRHLRPSVAVAGDWKVDFNGGGATVSEAMGYGMILTAYMAGHDPQAKQIFDGLNRLRKRYPSAGNPALMAWRIEANEAVPVTNAATDGDLDMAMGLVLAYAQWGDAAYRTEALALLGAIKTGLVRADHSLRLGDWDNVAGRTRPSDYMPAFFRAFHDFSGDAVWPSVEAKGHEIMESLQASHAASTGLLPDFAILSGGTWQPAGPGFLEGANDGKYYYNACRVPWRIGWAVEAFDDQAARRIAGRIMTWAAGAHAGPTAFRAGYGLDGSNISGNNYATSAFIAPTGVAAMASGHQAWLNAAFTDTSTRRGGYYENSIGLLCLLIMSGNAWLPGEPPEGGGDPPPPPPAGPRLDLLADGGWYGVADARSSLAAAPQPVDGKIAENWTVARMSAPGAYDTYVSLGVNIPGNSLTGLQSVRVTYKSDHPLSFALNQPGLSEYGESYRVVLSASATWRTVDLPVSAFAQPSWSTRKHIALDLAAIPSVSFNPEVDASGAAVNGRIEVSTLILDGLGNRIGYDAWALDLPAGQRGPAVRVGHSPVPNLVAYAFGRLPDAVEPADLPRVAPAADAVQVAHRFNPAATDVTMAYQRWDHAAGVWRDVAVLSSTEENARRTAVLDAEGDSIILRLRATKISPAP